MISGHHSLSVARRIAAELWRNTFNAAFTYATLLRLWSAFSGVITVLIIAHTLTPSMQGYYYTFVSLSSMGMLLELGLVSLVIVFASHEWSRLSFDGHRRPVGDPDALSRLASLAKFGSLWLGSAGVLFSIVLALVGTMLFSARADDGVAWRAPFLVLCVVNSVGLLMSLPLGLLEGCNQVAQAYFCRLGCAVLTSFALWAALLEDLKLWSVAIGTLVTIAWTVGYLTSQYRPLFAAVLSPCRGRRISWAREMLPLQWRTAISTIGTYLIFYTVTPILFRYGGPVLAGQMAVTWAAVETIAFIGATPINIKIPTFNMLVAKRNRRQLDRLTLVIGALSVGLSMIGALAFLGLVAGLGKYHFTFAHRLLPPLPTAILLLAMLMRQAGSPMTIYVRAHKVEPFAGLAIVVGGLFVGGSVVVAPTFGALGVATVYLCVIVLVALPVITAIFLACRRNHSEFAAATQSAVSSDYESNERPAAWAEAR